jgi:hypothetical protein
VKSAHDSRKTVYRFHQVMVIEIDVARFLQPLAEQVLIVEIFRSRRGHGRRRDPFAYQSTAPLIIHRRMPGHSSTSASSSDAGLVLLRTIGGALIQPVCQLGGRPEFREEECDVVATLPRTSGTQRAANRACRPDHSIAALWAA